MTFQKINKFKKIDIKIMQKTFIQFKNKTIKKTLYITINL